MRIARSRFAGALDIRTLPRLECARMAQHDAAETGGKATVWRRAKRALVLAVAGFLTLSVGLVVIYRFLPPPITPLMVIRLFEGEGLNKDWVAYGDVSPQVFKAVIAAEDTRFCQHYGFDFGSLLDAWKSNKKGRRTRGASTISMQTSKNLFLWPGGSYPRKVVEAYFAEFGHGIYGIEAAAQSYYKKSAKDLSAGEAARLAAIMPSPLRWSPQKPPRQHLSRIRGEMNGQPAPIDWRCPVGRYEGD
jgi:monofunctional glycosyltransferase